MQTQFRMIISDTVPVCTGIKACIKACIAFPGTCTWPVELQVGCTGALVLMGSPI